MNEPASATTALYTELADWYHLLTPPSDPDYAEEAELLLGMLRGAADGPIRSLLELGCGGGNLASCLPADVRLTLTDASEAMLRQSRRINPRAEHLLGDMRTLRLDRAFDAVLLNDAVMYLTTVEDLRAALETAFAHTRPGGAALFAPDAVAETWRPETEQGGQDGEDGRAMRYLEWTVDPDPADTTFIADFAFLVREADGTTRGVHDRHVLGLFPRATWLDLLEATGFDASVAGDRWGRVLFVARRPTTADGDGEAR